jgi:hypothetical protein
MANKPIIGKIIKAVAPQWWFLLLILLPQFIPSYASHGYKLLEWGKVNSYILTHPIKPNLTGLLPAFQIIPLILLVAIFLAGKRLTRIFSFYVALSYTLIAFLQSISISDRYGFAVLTANMITFLILAGLWLWETLFPKNVFDLQKKPAWKYWPILLALLAFWFPVNPHTLMPDFDPVYVLTSGTGLSFCMVTPLYLAILVIFFPHVNKPVLIATGLIGVVMSLGNFVLEFVMIPSYWWIGVLHFPLFILSSYSLVLSFREIAGQVNKTAVDRISSSTIE